DRTGLQQAQEQNDVVAAEEILRNAFSLDIRPLVAEAMRRDGGALDPVSVFRTMRIREKLIQKRGRSVATGL
ncbi:MAG: sugar isomerase, partial [Bacteroidota bacterium]